MTVGVGVSGQRPVPGGGGGWVGGQGQPLCAAGAHHGPVLPANGRLLQGRHLTQGVFGWVDS